MPEIFRAPLRMNCAGVDIVHPVDRMPEGTFPFLSNARVVEEGRIDSRPGYTSPFPASGQKHSIRRLNDEDMSYAPTGYIDVVGQGTDLYAGPDSALALIASGFSGDPLSLIPFRPEQSPESWMYVYDRVKQLKVRPDATTKSIGIAPPQGITMADYGPPAVVSVSDGQSTAGWTASGDAGAITNPSRWTATTITSITYNSGTSGWACLQPSQAIYVGNRTRVILGGTETVLLREIHPAITTTTIQGIDYDSGATGLCSIVLTGSPEGLTRNSLISIGGEIIRVLAVILSPDGSTYSLRCSAGTHSIGDAVTGLVSWYVYTTSTHAAGEAITSLAVYVGVHPSSTGYAAISLLSSIDASKAGGRPITIADDYLHISFWATNAPEIAQLQLLVDIDSQTTTLTPGVGGAFENNYIIWTLTPFQIFGAETPATGSWIEIVVPLSQGVRAGDDPTRTLANIKAIQIKIFATGSASCDFAFDWWYLFGTYGPTIQPNSPTGYEYQSRNRDSTTGAASVPGPQTRYDLFPLREQVLITPQTTAAPEVDSLDIYRLGGTLSQFTYVGTVVNNTGSPQTFSDNQPDQNIAGNPAADLTLIQPWPLEALPWSGTVDVNGTSVRLVSGSNFDPNLLSAQVILINGVAYQTYGQPHTTGFLEIFTSAGVQSGAKFQVASPTLAAQPLPFVFGSLEGPLSPVVLGIGDPINQGLLYWSNFSNADAASDQNSLEICSPSEPLISGAVWNGLIIVGSRENIYLVRYSYLQASGISFQFSRLPSPSGMWSRWSCCRGQDGVYFLGRDGIYRATDRGVESITDHALYPMFPHDGQPAAGANALAPVDMTQLPSLRLSAADEDIYFDYPAVTS